MTVSDNVYSATETTLTKTPALYRYTEIITKTFLISTFQSSSHEDVFTREPIRRFATAMATNEAFLGAKQVNPFHFQKFNLNSITDYRNVNSLEALAFGQHGHGVPHNDYANHYISVFDLTSTQQASHNYLYPQLTNKCTSLVFRYQKKDLIPLRKSKRQEMPFILDLLLSDGQA